MSDDYFVKLRRLDTLERFSDIVYKGDNFVTCFVSSSFLHTKSLWFFVWFDLELNG